MVSTLLQFGRHSRMVLVKVSEGTLEGTHEQNPYGGTFYSFKGVPYAEPPLGNLRFKAPQPPKPWKGVRSAREFGPDCHQVDLLTGENKRKFSEDCLYLNVNTPILKPAKPLPVMVWIHGGGFFIGTGSDELHGPEYLIRHDIVYVSLNYRLDVLGFLCLDIEEVPGNAGLKDQVAALRWVKKNISNFGGDPENITIFGESAGGVSVSFHLMSPMTRGLFKRAIAQSGSSICTWPNIAEPREKTIKFARKLGFKSTDPREILEFLQSLPVEVIVKHDVPIRFDQQAIAPLHLNFGVVSEKKFGDNETFFSGDMFEVLRQGIHPDVEVLSGYTEHEGVFGLLIRGLFDNVSKAADFSEFYCPEDIRYQCSMKEVLEVGRKLKKYHLKDELVNKVLDLHRNCVGIKLRDMNESQTNAWTCPACCNKRPKSDNQLTPLRKDISPSDNVTKRKKLVDDQKISTLSRDDLTEIVRNEIRNAVNECMTDTIQACIAAQFREIKLLPDGILGPASGEIKETADYVDRFYSSTNMKSCQRAQGRRALRVGAIGGAVCNLRYFKL